MQIFVLTNLSPNGHQMVTKWSVDSSCHKLSENIWFAWSKSSNYLIFEEGKSDYGQTHTQTDRQTEFPLVE